MVTCLAALGYGILPIWQAARNGRLRRGFRAAAGGTLRGEADTLASTNVHEGGYASAALRLNRRPWSLARRSQHAPAEVGMTLLVEASALTASLALGWGAARLALALLLAVAFRSRV
jgi:hypothetical protein